MKRKIAGMIKEDIKVKNSLLKTQAGNIAEFAKIIIGAVKRGRKILIFGNGGSASDSIHIAAEFVGRFKRERKAVPAIALSSNVSVITALGNDYGFDYIFERQVEALGRKGDLAIGLSTSGKSKNVLQGIIKASKLGLKTVVLTGAHKTTLSAAADLCIAVPSNNTPRIQEAHIVIAHIVCEIAENAL